MKDEWVRVKSEDELRAGMTVEVRICFGCNRRERFVLMSRERRATSGCTSHAKCVGWEITRARCGWTDFCTTRTIREGRLFKLVLREPEATETRAREREVARG